MERPQIDKPSGDIPFELGIEDLVVGEGDEATAGKTVTVHYVGVAFRSGEEFDASWNRGQPFSFKRIVIKAEKKLVKAVDREKWKEAHKKALAEIMDERVVTSPRKGGLSVYGTNVLMNMTNVIGGLPAKNSQFAAYENAEKISGEYVNDNILVDNPTCHACPVACKKEVEVKDGPYAGLRMESVEYEPAWSVGANCGNDDIRVVAKMIDLCNDFGMDAIEIGHPLSVYMEASERGYTNGDGPIAWGDGAKMVELATKIACREGIGNVMADGANATAQHFGHPELAMTVKGQ
ncbi:MAG TPA: aldehyde ferredoxin oxidoreductase C-terminal domain-containing protein, partial [Gaiellaceae bacterium]